MPVGGADLIPTFVALLGNHLDLTVLVDAKKGGHQKLEVLSAHGLLSNQRIVTIGDITGNAAADIEDLFSVGDYLSLFNETFAATLAQTDIPGNDPIVRRIARKLGGPRFDHGRPADVFLRHRDRIIPTLSEETFERFETLFKRINNTFPK